MSVVKRQMEWQQHKSPPIQDRLKQLLQLSRWTDCSFKVGDHNVEVIHGHKLVLAVSSPVFEALFFGPLASSGDTMISVPDIEPHTFKTLLHFVYSDEARLIGVREVGELLYAAKKYLIDPLSEICIDYLLHHTWIKTLWQILEIAEALDEETLLCACIKVMSHYHFELWGGREDGERLNVEILQRLLEEGEMSMSEIDLWEMAVEWVGEEAAERGLADNPDIRRRLLEELGIASRIRLLTIPYTTLVRLSPILSQAEIENLKRQREVPAGFSTDDTERKSASPLVWLSPREIIARKSNRWLSRAEVVCRISSTARVLVIGFEVLTRAAQLHLFPKSAASEDYSYREKLFLSVRDSNGNLLQRTEYDNAVYFDTSQRIHLKRPMWFLENTSYTVNIGYISGQYPISVAGDADIRQGRFYFDEMIIEEGDPDKKNMSSYILSVLYAL